MTHEDAIDTLLKETSDLAQRAHAEEHVATCKACWEVVRLLSELAEGETTADSLYGCEPVREQFYLLSACTPEEARRRYPDVARHVGWCHACRFELVTFLQVEREAAGGAYDEVIEVDPSPGRIAWKQVLGGAGERVHELLEHLAFRLHEGMISRISWPQGLAMTPLGAMAMRGASRDRGSEGKGSEPVVDAPGHRFQLDLDEATLDVNLMVEPQGKDRVRLEVRVLRGERSISMTLRRLEADQDILVAAQDASPAKTFVATNLLPGTYHLDVREQPRAERRRIRLSIERA